MFQWKWNCGECEKVQKKKQIAKKTPEKKPRKELGWAETPVTDALAPGETDPEPVTEGISKKDSGISSEERTMFINKFNMKIYIAYSVFYVIGTVLAFTIPFVNFNAIKSSEHLASHCVFFAMNAYVVVELLRKNLPEA